MKKSEFFHRLGRGVIILGLIAFAMIYIRIIQVSGWEAVKFDFSMLLAALIFLVPGYLLMRIGCIIKRFEHKEEEA